MATLTTTINYSEPAGSIVASLGTPGPAGPGVPPGGDAGQILAKIDGVSYNTEWIDPQDNSAIWGQITGTLANQLDLQGALDAKLDSSAAASTYLPLSGGYITGDIQSSNGSQYRTWNGGAFTAILAPNYLTLNNSTAGAGSISIDAEGISFASSPYKQTTPFLGLAGYATESWVTTQLGSYLTISSAAATYYPLTNPAGYITLSALSGYATESWVTSQGYLTSSALTPYLTISAAASTYYPLTNPSGFITSAALAGYATESWVNSQSFTTLADVQAQGYITDAPQDGPIYGRQLGGWTPISTGGAVWGSITGTLSDQTDLQGALDSKYDASNPSGFITAGFLADYARVDGTTFTGPINLGSDTTAPNAWIKVQGKRPTNSPGLYSARMNFEATSPNSPYNGDLWFNGSTFNYGASGAISVFASQSWVTSQGYITSSALTGYAQLSGATFTGKVNLATIGVQNPSVNLGSQVDPNATNAVAGDLWISNAASPKLSYKVGTSNLYCATSNLTNTFSSPQIIDTTSNTSPALRVTQKGTQPALVVEDALNPDTTATVIDQNGNLGVGVDAATWSAANKVEVVGAVKAQSITFDGTAQFKINSVTSHSTGANTNDLLISYNGSTYRIPLIFVSTP